MNTALTITGLTKKYSNFVLDNISFSIPSGSIVGLIGENGAGKSTTINSILGLIKKDSGKITVLGHDIDTFDCAVKEKIGVVFDGSNFSEELTPAKLSKVLRDIYSSWEQSYFNRLLDQLNIPATKKIKTFSKGMKMKLSIAVAFAHHPQLLILDEATSGLDPVMRDEMLDVFLEFVQEENHSILLSSHITSDLEKVADYITFIHNGKLIMTASKNDLAYNYAVMRCTESQFLALDQKDILAYRKRDFQIDVLVSNGRCTEKVQGHCDRPCFCR